MRTTRPGGSGDDRRRLQIHVTPGDDVIVGSEGDDKVGSGPGDDNICAEEATTTSTAAIEPTS